MNEMLNYIFKTLGSTENRINTMRKAMRNQKWFNEFVVYYMAVNTIFMYAQKLKQDELGDRITELQDRLDKVEGKKGAK